MPPTLRRESAALLMLNVPITLPTPLAAHSVVGERDQTTLDPLLTTPVTERELIVGRANRTAVTERLGLGDV